jgi:hypothetical protein
MSPGSAPPDPPPSNPGAPDRRSNHALREVLDELIDHVREISRSRDGLSRDKVDYAQERLEWLADEIWRLTIEGDDSVE